MHGWGKKIISSWKTTYKPQMCNNVSHLTCCICPWCIFLGLLVQFQTSLIVFLNVMATVPLCHSPHVLFTWFPAETVPWQLKWFTCRTGAPLDYACSRIVMSWKMHKVQGPSDKAAKETCKNKETTIRTTIYQLSCKRGLPLCMWRGGAHWIHCTYCNLYYESALSVRWFFLATLPSSFSPVLLKYLYTINERQTNILIVSDTRCLCSNESSK